MDYIALLEYMWYIDYKRRIINVQIQQNIFTRQEEGWIAMRTDLRKYLVNTTQTNRDILDHLMDCGAFDKTKAKTIKELAEALQLHPKYIGPALKEMSASGWLLKFKESKFIYYYANNERVNGLSKTILPESMSVKVKEPSIKKEKKLTPPKKELQEVFDLFNEELVKVFGQAKKLQVLNDKRKKDIQKLIDLKLDLRIMFKGFFLDRKELENDFIDFHYVLKNPERYLNKGSATKQVDDQLLRKKKDKYLNYIMDGKQPEQFGLNKDELGVTDEEIQAAKERYEYERELLG